LLQPACHCGRASCIQPSIQLNGNQNFYIIYNSATVEFNSLVLKKNYISGTIFNGLYFGPKKGNDKNEILKKSVNF